MMESPAYHKGNEHLLSPQYSVVDSLEKYMHTYTGSGPSSCFFSLAHPTAPVRPVRLIINQASNSTSRIIIGQSETQSQRCQNKMSSNCEEIKIDSDFVDKCDDYSPRTCSNKNDTTDCRDTENHSGDWNNNNLDGGRYFLPDSSEHSLIAAEGNLLCTLQCGTSCIVLWRVGQVAVAAEEQEEQEEEEEGIDSSEYSQSLNNISMATSTTVANSSVIGSRRYNFRDRERDLTASPSSFLHLSASGTSRQVSNSLHSNSLSMNVSNSSGGSGSATSLAGGMITSALMPFESLSGPSISLERDIRRSARVSNSHSKCKPHSMDEIIIPFSIPTDLFIILSLHRILSST